MKNLFLILMAAAFCATSCSTVYKSATTQNIKPTVTAAVLSDLEVSNQKISYTLVPSQKVLRGGLANCINTAISEALEINGGDVLLETQNALIVRGSKTFGKIKSVTVTGYPAKYKNFRSADDETLQEIIKNNSYSQGVHVIKNNGSALLMKKK